MNTPPRESSNNFVHTEQPPAPPIQDPSESSCCLLGAPPWYAVSTPMQLKAYPGEGKPGKALCQWRVGDSAKAGIRRGGSWADSLSESCDPSTGQRSWSPYPQFGGRACRSGPPPPTPTPCTWSPTYGLASPPPWLHNLAVSPTLPGPSTRLPTLPHHPSLLGSGRSPGSHGYVQRVWGGFSAWK